ncbi:zinc ribbon domain-containing protein [Halobaculum sp. MBLA0147]|uniref:zinc ribbon domain-containing protein n=1 Tax=Halobaculum sp. MBLA0147 TaxID=3079934 RepID=UPI0035244962
MNGESPRIVGGGAYAPRNRLSSEAVAEAWGRSQARGVERVAVPDADEDSLTMAAAAARRALAAADRDAGSVELLVFATTTPPVEEPELTPRLGEFLGVPETAARRTHAGGTRAGTAALADALAALGGEVETTGVGARAATDGSAPAGVDGPALVVAADAPLGEPNDETGHAAGAAAGALVLDTGRPEGDDASAASGARVLARGEYATDYAGTRGRERGAVETGGLDVTTYDRAAFREPATGAVDALVAGAPQTAPDPSEVDALAITAPDGDRPARVAGALDCSPDRITTPVRRLGDTGAAGPLVGLVRSFADGPNPTGDADDTHAATGAAEHHTLCVGVGSGGAADAALIAGTAPVSTRLDGTRTVSYTDALRLRDRITGDAPAGGGAAVSVPTWRRSRAARYRLVAGACPNCGALSFPAEGACGDCHDLVSYDRVRLPRTGELVTVTGIAPGGAPPEFVPQAERGGDFPVGIVRFERDGETVDVPMQVCDADAVGRAGDASGERESDVGDTAPESSRVTAGDTVGHVVRRVYEQEGVVRYGAKARPVDD